MPIFIACHPTITANLANPPFYCRFLVVMNEWWGAGWGCACRMAGVSAEPTVSSGQSLVSRTKHFSKSTKHFQGSHADPEPACHEHVIVSRAKGERPQTTRTVKRSLGNAGVQPEASRPAPGNPAKLIKPRPAECAIGWVVVAVRETQHHPNPFVLIRQFPNPQTS